MTFSYTKIKNPHLALSLRFSYTPPTPLIMKAAWIEILKGEDFYYKIFVMKKIC